jgi:hypothetical protein
MDDVVLGKVEIIERCRGVDIVESIVERHLDDLLAFARIAVRTLDRE